jgi:hypothetical protein
MCVNAGTYPACGCESQTGTFSITTLDSNAETSLFEDKPRVLFPCGVLYFKLKKDASGKLDYNLSLSDGAATSPPMPFTIIVLKTNIAPFFTWSRSPWIQVLEDSGLYTEELAQNISVDGRNGELEPEQRFSWMLSPAFSDIFSASSQPRMEIFESGSSRKARLIFTPADNSFGVQRFNVTLTDDGGIARGGINSFVLQLTITVLAVNDPPTFSVPSSISVLESSGTTMLIGFASAVSAGAPDEAHQHITFVIDYMSAPELFARAPSISPNGTLTIIPKPLASGYTVMRVRLVDDNVDGGPENHRSTSVSHQFIITVKAVDDTPDFSLPWNVECRTTEFLRGHACTCPVVATVVEPATPPAACYLHNATSFGPKYLCPTTADPYNECGWMGYEGASKAASESKVSVLEDSGAHSVDGFAQDIASAAGGSVGTMTRFFQTTWHPELEMLQSFRDDVLGQPGLEYAHQYTGAYADVC